MRGKDRGSSFLVTFLGAASLIAGAFAAFVAIFDPYGVSPLRLGKSGPLMDINQRYMYPQVARSLAFDSAVFGTSTVRLLDPPALNAALGGRFANLAMNAATPWEQLQLARLFIREHPAPKTVILGIDSPWCEADADEKRLTFRAFPESFYDSNPYNDFAHLFSFKTVEIAARMFAWRLDLAEPRIRDDGYEYFLPPESDWSPDYVRPRLWGPGPERITPAQSPVRLDAAQREALRFPAVGWLRDFVAALPTDTRLIVLMPPIHVAGQPQPGSLIEAREQECHARIADAVRPRSAPVISMQFANAITTADDNYWDALHFRLKIAEMLPGMIAEASRAGAPDSPLWRRLDR